MACLLMSALRLLSNARLHQIIAHHMVPPLMSAVYVNSKRPYLSLCFTSKPDEVLLVEMADNLLNQVQYRLGGCYEHAE